MAETESLENLQAPWPEGFHAQQMPVTGGTQYVRVGGKRPAVILLHGFGDTGDMWVPLAARLVKDRFVIIPDLRGMGLSSHPEGGYEKVAQARDFAAILDQLSIKDAALVTHDIGNMVGYALAALYPQRITKWVVMDAPLPGIGHWDDQLKIRRRGTSTSVDRMWSGLWPDANASCSIASTTNCRPIPPTSMSGLATITQRFMRGLAPSTTPSADSLRRLHKTRSTTSNSLRKES
jgi:pimeloyl-ACP methyl ester carboxylesterase